MKEVTRILPIIPLRGITVFPNMVTYFDVGREKSINAVKKAMEEKREIFLVPQKEDEEEEVKIESLLRIGTLAIIKQIVNFNNGTMRVLVEGISRASLLNVIEEEGLLKAEILNVKEKENEELNLDVLKEELLSKFEDFLIKAKIDEKSIKENINEIKGYNQIIDIVSSYIVLDNQERKKILETVDLKTRLELLITLIIKEIEILELEKKIKVKLNKKVDKNQKEYYLKEQLRIIKEELGDNEEKVYEDLKTKLKKLKIDKESKEKLCLEIAKLEKENIGSQEKGTIESYIEEVFAMPWGKYSKDNLDIKNSRAILEKKHYGLKKVKEEILEYLSVKSFNKDIKLPILCLIGPPGVGKTSIAKSISESLNRSFERISLGGVNDEAEIRGHRKTYVGAMPGRIVEAVKKSKTMNPVILLDEIDKIGSKHQKDPYSALLEVLDWEQNKKFRDNYLEIAMDLSDVIFIATANNLDNIPRELLDRMSILELSGYTYEEKKQIAKTHLIPKILSEHKVQKGKIIISDNALDEVINHYTRESGVRQLGRVITKLIRKSIKYLIEKDKEKINITKSFLEKFLGEKIYSYDRVDLDNKIGLVNGMAWTAYGGDTLAIEAVMMEGTGKLELTGNLGEVMQESAKTAYSYVRANADKYPILEKEFYKKKDIHIHVPEGAVPKDGPSAGITMVTALLSLLTDKAIASTVAMTGEVTLTGKVLPIGGLKEKILAAVRVGVDTVIIPKKNSRDLKEIPKKIIKNIKVIEVSEVDEVIKNTLI